MGGMSEITPPNENNHPRPGLQKASLVAFDVSLVILIMIGIFFRFNWVNWNQNTDLHPDEYGLTGTLTALSIPKNLGDYFNTRLSPISPYQKYDENGAPTQNGPDNSMRWGQWPIIIIRTTAELTGNSGYIEMRLLGRSLSALADTLSLLMIFLIGLRLYGRRVGLLAAALSSLAVMQIQQSHFMTVDNFGGFFAALAMYACVRIAQAAPVTRPTEPTPGQAYGPAWPTLGWYALFGVAFGMALACKVNLAPIGGMALVAALIGAADIKLKSMNDLRRIFGFSVLFLVLGLLAAAVTFRVTQPMSFRATTGDTSLLTLIPNPDWVESMKVAQVESSGKDGGPPAEQWAHRPAIIFPLVNMVVWGMGLPLGIFCWLAFGAALWQVGRYGRNWRAHLLVLVWAGGDFFSLGMLWVKSVRYFLPVYPFLCLLAAWGLIELWRWARDAKPGQPARKILAAATLGLVLFGTLAWANAYVQAVYVTPHTRIQAAHWIFQNIAGPFHLTMQDAQGNTVYEPVSATNGLTINREASYIQSFMARTSGKLTQVTLPHVQANGQATLRIAIAGNSDGTNVLGETQIPIPQTRSQVTGAFQGIPLTAGDTYFLVASTPETATVSVFQNTLSNEGWDESLPMRMEDRDPFGGLYTGLGMEVRWRPDTEDKKDMFINVLTQTDYIILPSQRGIWSTCRIPLSYPMTMDYYRALFDGRLGFEQAAVFSAPLKLGPLWISDVGGTFAWNQTPSLPLFNRSWLAAEEAFSIYDHPPVWIFKKRADFNLEQAKAVLNAADLTKVVHQGPTEATGYWCPEQ